MPPLSVATLTLLLILAVSSLSQAFRASLPASGIDYYQFWAVGRAIAQNEATDIYSKHGRTALGMRFFVESRSSRSPLHRAVAEQRLVLETTATPFLYSVFGAFSTADYAANLRNFRAALVICFAFGVVGFGRILSLGATNTLLALVLLCSSFEPLFSDLRVGNVGCLQLFGVAVYAILRSQPRTPHRFLVAGLLMGLLVAFKPNLVFAAVIALFASFRGREYRALVLESTGLAAGAAFAVTYSALQIGSFEVWLDWLNALRNVPDQNITTEFGNYSLVFAMRTWARDLAPLALMLTVAAAGALGWWARATRSTPTTRRAPVGHRMRAPWWLAVGCLTVVLLPRLAWLHYFVLVVPAMLVALRNLLQPLSRPRAPLRYALTISAWVGLCVNVLALSGAKYDNTSYGYLVFASMYLLVAATIAAADERLTGSVPDNTATPSDSNRQAT